MQSWRVAFRCKNGLCLKPRRGEWQNCQSVPCPFQCCSFFSDHKMAAEWLTILYCSKKKHYHRRRRYSIYRINLQREIYREFYHLVDEVLIDEEKCLSYIRMRPCTFHSLLDLIAPYITIRELIFENPSLPLSELRSPY